MTGRALFAFRPDAARSEIRKARAQFEHARNCAADCRYQSGEPVPQSVADYWRRHALDMAQYHRGLARHAITAAWPVEWRIERMTAFVPGRKPTARRAAA